MRKFGEKALAIYILDILELGDILNDERLSSSYVRKTISEPKTGMEPTTFR